MEQCIALQPWYGDFYAHLNVFVQSLFGLVGPYKLLHGGAQGDSMGVGRFKELNNVRTRVNAMIVSEGLCPESGRRGALGPRLGAPRTLRCPQVPEVSGSDDRRIFSFTDAALQRVLRMSQMSCLAAAPSTTPNLRCTA